MGKALPTVRLQAGRTLLLEGPASVRLEDGEGSILGAPLFKGWALVREDRQIPIETSTGAGLEVRLGQEAKYKIIQESTIPTGWREASQIALQSPGTVVILGDVDSGKSTLCAFLANECFRHGLHVSVIDGDIGQADIGPPTTISIAPLKGHVFSLQDLRPEVSLFVGDTSPSSVSEKLSQGLVRLKKSATEADALLVNTDGWVRGEDAIRYKVQLLSDIRPDLVLGISSEGELDPLLELQRSTALKLNRSPYARTRSREERKKAREFGYKRFLQNAKRRELRLRDVELRRFDSRQQQLRLDSSADLRGVLAGLLDDDERLLSIGRIEKIRDGLLTMKTALEDTPKIVELGAVVLSPSFEELAYAP